MATSTTDEHLESDDDSSSKRHSTPLSNADLTVLVCFFASGFLALTYEVCWIRKSTHVFGAASLAVSTVLGVFFGGLALGSYLFGRRAPQVKMPMMWYAALEVGVGVLAMLSPYAFRLADQAYTHFYPQVQDSFALLSCTRLLLVTIVVLPPTILMGGTFPLFCRQYVRHRGAISKSIGWLYGVNTLGAAAGAAACGFYFIPEIGIQSTILVSGIANIVIAAIVWATPFATTTDPGAEPAEKSDTNPVSPEDEPSPASLAPLKGSFRWTVYALFFFAGFVALGNEVLWTRHLSLIMENTVYTYTSMLTIVLLGIVAGSILAATLFDRLKRRAFIFGAVQITSGLAVLIALLLPPVAWGSLIDTSDPVRQFLVFAMILAVPAILSGAAFPLAIRMIVEHPDDAAPSVGRMTALNTAGGIVGSLAIGFVIMPAMGAQATMLLITAVSLLVGAAAWLLLDTTFPTVVRGGLVAAVVAIWCVVPGLMGTEVPKDFLVSYGELLDFREGLASNMAIVRRAQVTQLEINRLPQGFDRKTHQVMAAHVPCLLHPDPKDVVVVGLGVGQTARSFLVHDVDRLDVVEIEGRMKDLVAPHFPSEWMDDPRVHFIYDDGRNYVTHSGEHYDVISVEVGQVFRPGLMGFYTAEFYEGARKRLKKGGVLSQFMPIDFFSIEEFQTLLASFHKSFPQSVLWFNTSELLLIGSEGSMPPHMTPGQFDFFHNNETLQQELDFAYYGIHAHKLKDIEVFMAGLISGPNGIARMAAGAPLYRDDLPYMEYKRERDPTIHLQLINYLTQHMDPVESVINVAQMPAGEFSLSTCNEVRRTNLPKIRANLLGQLAVKQAGSGNFQEAFQLCLQAIEVVPGGFPPAYYQLGTGLLKMGNDEEAIEAYRDAIRVDPDHGESHNNLGYVLRRLGRFDEAIVHLRESIRIYGDSPESLNGVARILATHPDETKRNPTEAVALATTAVKLSKGQNPMMLDSLAAAHAAAGDFPQAIAIQKKALSSAQYQPAKYKIADFESRLHLYEQGNVFTDPTTYVPPPDPSSESGANPAN